MGIQDRPDHPVGFDGAQVTCCGAGIVARAGTLGLLQEEG